MVCTCCDGTGVEEVSYGDHNDWDVWVGRCEKCNGTGDTTSCDRCHRPVPYDSTVPGEEFDVRYMRFCRTCAEEMHDAMNDLRLEMAR